MPSIWDKFEDLFTGAQHGAIHDLRIFLQSGGIDMPFSNFSNQKVSDLSDSFEDQFAVIPPPPPPTPPLTYVEYLSDDFADKANSVFASCTDATTKVEEFAQQFPGNMQEAVVFTVNDLIDKAVITSIYDLQTIEGAALKTYFKDLLDYPLCQHTFIRQSAQNLLNNASDFLKLFKYSFAYSIQINPPSSGWDTGTNAANWQDYSAVVYTNASAPFDSLLFSGTPSPSGLITFNYDTIKDGDNPFSPATLNGKIQFVDADGNLISGTDAAISFSVGGSTSTVSVNITPPAGSHGDFITNVNTLEIDVLTDAPISLSIPGGLQTILTNNNIVTLADIRKIGGLTNAAILDGLYETYKVALDALDRHARLEPVTLIEPIASTGSPTNSYYASQALINGGVYSAHDMAELPVAEVVKICTGTIGGTPTNYGELNAVNAYNKAKIQAALTADYLNGYLTLGQTMMENTDPDELLLLTETPPSNFLQTLQEKCTCTNCETALSPQAYLLELIQYIGFNIKKKVGGTESFMTITELANQLHQPFDSLPGNCEDVDDLICQQRLAVEILRSYDNGASDLDSIETDYANKVYTYILTQLGTSKKEALSYQNQPAEKIREYANRLGLYIDEEDSVDVTNFFSLLLPDLTDTPTNDVEVLLEALYGIRSTQTYQLSQGMVFGEDADQISRWRLTNVQYLKHTYEDGAIELKLLNSSGTLTLELYKAGSVLIGSGSRTGVGVIKISEGATGFESDIIGYFEVTDATAFDQGDAYIQPYSKLHARKLRFLYNSFEEADFPEEAETITQVAIDPDIIGPADIYYPWDTSTNKVFELWSDRRTDLDNSRGDITDIIEVAPTDDVFTIGSSGTGVAGSRAGDIYAYRGTSYSVAKFLGTGSSAGGYNAWESVTVTGADTVVSDGSDLYCNLDTNQLVASYDGTNKKIAGYEIYDDYKHIRAKWRVKDIAIDSFSQGQNTFVRQDKAGDLLLTSYVSGHYMMAKYFVPRTVNKTFSTAEKPFLTSKGTLFVPDSKYGAVREISAATGEVIRTIGYDVKEDLVSYLKMNETSGTSAADSSGEGNGGTLTGSIAFSTAAPPDYGVTMVDTAVNGYVKILSDPLIDDMTVNERTVEVWFKRSNVSRKQVIYREGDDTTGFIAYIENGILYCGFITGSFIKYIQVGDVPVNEWKQLVFVLNATGDSSTYFFKAYLDSKLIGSRPAAALSAHATYTSIGNLGGISSRWANNSTASGDNSFAGIIHNFRIWNRVFTEQEVKDLYLSSSDIGNLLYQPVAVCSNAAGDIFVADKTSLYIHVFDADGNFLRKFGGPNSTSSFVAGKFTSLADICISPEGQLFVLDDNLDAIEVFDETGSYLRAFGQGVPGYSFPSITGAYVAIEVLDDRIYIFTQDSSSARLYEADYFGNAISTLYTLASSTAKDFSVTPDKTFAMLIEKSTLPYLHIEKSGETACEWHLGGYEITTDNTSFISASPVTGKGIVAYSTKKFYVTDVNGSISSSLYTVQKPFTKSVSGYEISSIGSDSQNRVYLGYYENADPYPSFVARYDVNGDIDTSYGDDETGIVEILGTRFMIDAFDHLYSMYGIHLTLAVYNDKGELVKDNVGELCPGETFAGGFNNMGISGDGRVLATFYVPSLNFSTRAVDPTSNFGATLNYIFSQIGVGNSYYTFAQTWMNELQGLDISNNRESLNLTPASYSFLKQLKISAYKQISSTEEEWEYVKDILVNSYKRSKYSTWRTEEKTEGITYSPYYFNYDPLAQIDFNPTPYRTTISERQAWEDRVAARYEQISQLSQALVNTIDSSDDQFLPYLRDGILKEMTVSGATTIEEKADVLQKKLLYDFQFNCCHKTTRISSAIQTLQSYVQAVRDGSFTLASGDIQITHQDFDKKWAIMGTYETWRAATFLYLYPENLLQPGIKPIQSQVFREVLTQIQESSEFNSQSACDVTAIYSQYFEDISSMKLVGASRTSVMEWKQGACGSEYESGFANFNFVFGQAEKSGRLYYMINDKIPEKPESFSIKQMWQQVPNLNDLKVSEFCGVSNFRQTLGISWLFLFFKAWTKEGRLVFGFTRFNTVKHEWDSQFTELDIKGALKTDTDLAKLSIKAIYSPFCWHRPFLAILDAFKFTTVGITQDATALDEMSLNTRNGGFGYLPEFEDPAEQQKITLHAVIDVSMLGVGNTAASPFVIIYENSNDTDWNLTTACLTDVNNGARGQKVGTSGKYGQSEYIGFAVDQANAELHVFQKKDTEYFDTRISIGNFNTIASATNRLTAPLGKVVPLSLTWPIEEHFNTCYISYDPGYKYPSGGVVITNPTWEAYQGFGLGIKQAWINFKSSTGGNLAVFSNRYQVSPANADNFYRVIPQDNAASLNDFAKKSASLYQQNIGADPKVMEYIAEAFYFLPMAIAGKLQQGGYYQQSLDWYKLIYNYQASSYYRKIYYGLKAEANVQAQFSKANIYLEDNINPHTVAVSRPDAYTRYTAASIVSCLLDYADSEFTADTASAVTRADQLYNQALSLINTFTYNSPVNACDDVFDHLTATVTDLLWIPVWDRLLEAMHRIENPKVLWDGTENSVIDQINDVFLESWPIEQKLTESEKIINTALAAQEGIETMTKVTDNAKKILGDGELYIYSDKVNVFDNPVAYSGQGSAKKNAMTFTMNALFGQAQERFAIHASNVATVSTTDVFTNSGTKKVDGLATTFSAPPSGNVVVLQDFNKTISGTSGLVYGTYDQSAEFANSGVPSIYTAAGPAPEQLTLQLTAENSQFAFAGDQPQQRMTMSLTSWVYCVPKNPIMQMLKAHADINLYKIRNCRNIGGAVRDLAPFAVPTDATSGLPVALNGSVAVNAGNLSSLRPTQYRYSFLVERAKNLCNIAQQMEASMLSSLEKLDAESYAVMKANQDLSLTRQTVQLQNIRVNESDKQITLATQQRRKSEFTYRYFADLVDDGLNGWETASLITTQVGFALLAVAGGLFTAAALAPDINGAVDRTTALATGVKTGGELLLNQANFMQQMASYQRRKQEWEFQRNSSAIDIEIADTQISIAEGQKRITEQELRISEMQSKFAEDSLNFLRNKFTNAELYAFMSQQLNKIYKWFLNQATGVARQAAIQLSFERQQDFSQTIQNNYYESPSSGQSTNPDQNDRKGLTGSARLLKDIYILENNAVNTSKRKLQVSKTISLASLDPVVFQQFRSTGILPFTTTHEMFDLDFPGQYMRLIQNVRVNVIALVPPVQGVKAALRSLGTSRTIVGADFPQEVLIRREPDMIVLSSPLNPGSTYELQNIAPELYRPFENSGAAMSWVFEMPLYTNRINYDSIADIQVTIDYSADYSDILKEQVLKRLGDTFRAQRAFSTKLFYPDAWYDLYNPATGASTRSFKFKVERENFPVNMDHFTIKGISMYFQAKAADDGLHNLDEVTVAALKLTPATGSAATGGETTSAGKLISTSFINGIPWSGFAGKEPFGTWEAEINRDSGEGIERLIAEDRLEDIIFIVEYQADLPGYPSF